MSLILPNILKPYYYYFKKLIVLKTIFFLKLIILNIARGTTDPEIDSVTWTKFGDNMAPLA